MKCKLTAKGLGAIVFSLFLFVSGAEVSAQNGSANLKLEGSQLTGTEVPVEGPLEPFMGEVKFAMERIFEGERFPNVVVGTDGTVLATWGSTNLSVRRSGDGGATWGSPILIGPGIHGGGVTVDETSGDIQAFVEGGHPPAPLTVYRSRDHGLSWEEDEVTIHADENGKVPSMHMNEHGITLRHSEWAGRLIRPTRSYAGGTPREYWPEHYTNAIYSDDGGKTWHTSAPFPAMGTGEATLAELADGTIYYNSRRHLSSDGLNSLMRHIAWSKDGGETWRNLSVSDVLPDGPQNTTYGLMAGLVRLPVANRDILLFSNVESASGRRNGHVWVSIDGGLNWPIKRRVEEDGFAYSSMAAGRPGTPSEGWIYLLYETGGHPESGGKVARFNLSWALEGVFESAWHRLEAAETLLNDAEIGDRPGNYPADAVADLTAAKLSLEELLGRTTLRSLLDEPGAIEEFQRRDAELENAILECKLSRITADGAVIFVENGVALAMEEIGTPWQEGENYLSKQGTGNGLVTLVELLEGDFRIEVLLALDKIDGTAASFVFGVNPPESISGGHFGLDSGSRTFFVEGGIFGSLDLLDHSTADFIQPGEPFLVEAVRVGDTLTLSVNDVAVYQKAIGPGPIGFLGLRPWRAEMRVYDFRATGNFDLAPTLAGFPGWTMNYFTEEQRSDPGISGAVASAAGDGVANLVKYALGLSPLVSVSAGDLPELSRGGDGSFAFVYQERADIDDIAYIPEVSENLVVWENGEGNVVEVFREPVGDNFEEVGVRADQAEGFDQMFIRLRISQIK